jgi:hypothetical protein
MMATDFEALHNAALEADEAWSRALVEAYGQRFAGDYRYTKKGYATPELKQLRDAKQAADQKLREAHEALRRSKQ